MSHPTDHPDRKFYNASAETGYVQALLEQGVPYETALQLDKERQENGGKVPVKEVKLVIEEPALIEAPMETELLEVPKDEDV